MTTTLFKRQNGNEIAPLGTLLNNLFEGSFPRSFGHNFLADAPLSTPQVPVNIRETDKEYQIDLIAPGCRKEDFKVHINEKLLTVAFSPEQMENDNEKVTWARNEYVQPSFSKTFMINDSVDINKINATYRDGILRVSLGKNEQAKSSVKQIHIN